MALAAAMGKYPDELRADFQRFYNLNIDDMGDGYTVAHAAALASQLPRGSRLSCAMSPENEWGVTDHLLRVIEHDLRSIAWNGKGERPKPLRIPRKPKPARPADNGAIAEKLGIPEERR